VGRSLRGIDIRHYGSGNIGTTNAFRILGPQLGVLVLIGDFSKGAIAVWIAQALGSEYLAVGAGLAAMAGHNWSIFLGFRGGRGVATAAGAVFALDPWGVLVLFLIWTLTILITRYVSVGSIAAALAAPFVVGLTSHSWLLAGFGLVAGCAVVYRHIPNLERLRNGTEPQLKGSWHWR